MPFFFRTFAPNPLFLNLDDDYKLLNFYINKEQGAYYSFAELDRIVNTGQISLYNDYYTKYGTSQRINDALSPFKRNYTFTNGTSPGGFITFPADYFNYLAGYVVIMDASNVLRNVNIDEVDEATRIDRINSQVIPLSASRPIGMRLNTGMQLYPSLPQAGVITYFKKPVQPYYAYTLISGRIPVYNSTDSIQLEWNEKDHNAVLIRSLSLIGINISEGDIITWAEKKNQDNNETPMKE